jgi:hypothetical protein
VTITPDSSPDRRLRSARRLEHAGRATVPKALQEAALHRGLVWRMSGGGVERNAVTSADEETRYKITGSS